MISFHKGFYSKGWKIRLKSALRCLFYRRYILVCWKECEDGDLDFKVTHQGVKLPEAVHRVKVDAAEILQQQAPARAEDDLVRHGRAVGSARGLERRRYGLARGRRRPLDRHPVEDLRVRF